MQLSSSPLSDTLDTLRQEIDTLDAQMHALLIQRSTIIDRLIAVKGTAQSGSAFRPAREAEMMQALVKRHSGHLPLSTMEHIWRTIIATFTHIQAPFQVHVSDGLHARAMHDLARFHMGFEVPLIHHDTSAAVVAAVTASSASLGLIGLDDPDALPLASRIWWQELGGQKQPRIMARLPFLLMPDHPVPQPALVIGSALDEHAPTDMSVVAVESEKEFVPSSDRELLAQMYQEGRWHFLLAVKNGMVPHGARHIGSYALPMTPHQENIL
jgi:chorismate mutase